jgi:hypothetical protein
VTVYDVFFGENLRKSKSLLWWPLDKLSNAGNLSTIMASFNREMESAHECRWNLSHGVKYDDSKKGVSFFLSLFYAVCSHLLLSSAAVSIPTNWLLEKIIISYLNIVYFRISFVYQHKLQLRDAFAQNYLSSRDCFMRLILSWKFVGYAERIYEVCSA